MTLSLTYFRFRIRYWRNVLVHKQVLRIWEWGRELSQGFPSCIILPSWKNWTFILCLSINDWKPSHCSALYRWSIGESCEVIYAKLEYWRENFHPQSIKICSLVWWRALKRGSAKTGHCMHLRSSAIFAYCFWHQPALPHALSQTSTRIRVLTEQPCIIW